MLQLHTSGFLGVDHSVGFVVWVFGVFWGALVIGLIVQKSAFSGLSLRSVGTEKIASCSLEVFSMFHRC